MDKYLVIGFDNELKAYEGSRALQDLQNEGSLNLYAKAVIVRDASGKVAVKQEGDAGPIGTAGGLLTGSFIGMLGGAGSALAGLGRKIQPSLRRALEIASAKSASPASATLLPRRARKTPKAKKTKNPS